MGNNTSKSYCFASYKDIQNMVHKSDFILINTLPKDKQHTLIQSTCAIENEERVINDALNGNNDIIIFIYGAHNCDHTVYKKYDQLQSLGFKNVYVYTGGLFEWCCLQDIYGEEFFKLKVNNAKIDLLELAPSECCSYTFSKRIQN
jgi:hypothetical protein